MASFRGDAWRFYQKLVSTKQKGDKIDELKEIVELKEIEDFYETLDDSTLMKIRYRMMKEKKGSGIIPIFVSSVPWLLFIFSKQLQTVLFKNGGYLWVGFVFLYIITLIFSVIVHFRENAWAYVHTKMIEDILKRRNKTEYNFN